MKYGVFVTNPVGWVEIDAQSGDEAAERAHRLRPGGRVLNVIPANDVPALRERQQAPLAAVEGADAEIEDAPAPLALAEIEAAPAVDGPEPEPAKRPRGRPPKNARPAA